MLQKTRIAVGHRNLAGVASGARIQDRHSDRLHEIPDAHLEREAGFANATQLARRLTPAMLVRLAGQATRKPASTEQ